MSEIPAAGAMSPAAYAKYIGVSRAFVYQQITAGVVVARKLGKRTLIFLADNEGLRESLPRLGAEKQS
jgi:hypothetical protein